MTLRTHDEHMKWRTANLTYQADCINALMNQPLDVLISKSGWTLNELYSCLACQTQTLSYKLAKEFFDKNPDINFPGKTKYAHFLLSENLSGEGTI